MTIPESGCMRRTDLSRRQRRTLIWGCYWRALLFMAAQVILMVPILYVIFGAAETPRSRVLHGWLPFALLVALEAFSFVLGLWVVALYVRHILNRPIGDLQFSRSVVRGRAARSVE